MASNSLAAKKLGSLIGHMNSCGCCPRNWHSAVVPAFGTPATKNLTWSIVPRVRAPSWSRMQSRSRGPRRHEQPGLDQRGVGPVLDEPLSVATMLAKKRGRGDEPPQCTHHANR